MPNRWKSTWRAQFLSWLLVSGLAGILLLAPDSAAKDPCAQNPLPYAWVTLDYANPNIIKRLQTGLRDKGFDPGAIDSIIGKNTRKAIGRFQRAQRLEPSSTFDRPTVDGLLGPAAGEALFPSREEHKIAQDAYLEDLVSLCSGAAGYVPRIGD